MRFIPFKKPLSNLFSEDASPLKMCAYRQDPFDRILEAMKAAVNSYLKTLVFEGGRGEHLSIYIYICTHYLYVHMYISTFVCLYICIHIYICTYPYICVCVCVCACIYIYVRAAGQFRNGSAKGINRSVHFQKKDFVQC